MSPHATTRRRFVSTVTAGAGFLAGTGLVTAGGHGQRNFRAHLSGEEQVPPVDTNAQGQAKFQLNHEGDALDFRLLVANIDDVTGAHVHLAPEGENGPIVVPLFGDPLFTDPVTVNGTLAEGSITASDVIGPLSGDFDGLLEKMRSSGTYVNVHTLEHGPGEIRGQIF